MVQYNATEAATGLSGTNGGDQPLRPPLKRSLLVSAAETVIQFADAFSFPSCGQHAQLDGEADFNLRIVMQCRLRNVSFRDTTVYPSRAFSLSRGGWVGRCVF